jgi:hypothetical protein
VCVRACVCMCVCVFSNLNVIIYREVLLDTTVRLSRTEENIFGQGDLLTMNINNQHNPKVITLNSIK